MSVVPTEHSQPKQKGRFVALLVGVAALVVLATVSVKIWQSHRAYHLATVQEGVLYRDGAKSESQLAAALDDVHPKTVVSLVDAAEQSDPGKPQFAQESKLCDSRGIQLWRIEVKLGGWPSSENIREFLAIVNDTHKQPVLVHCAQGVRRTAFFVAAYQESVLGYDKAKAKDAILTFGHSESTINDIRRFIDGYDPKTQTVSPDLARTTEGVTGH
jgi:protein tyrosine/serine phosphatase